MDYFNDRERKGQLNFASRRDKFFAPLIKKLAAWKVTPNQVSVIGLVLLLGGAACPTNYYPLFIVLVGLYCISDGIDGGLARRTNKVSEGGSLVDVVIDQAGPVVLAASYTYHIPSCIPAFAVLFSNTYLVSIALVLFSNGNHIPIKFTFFRVKYIFYIFYCASFILKIDMLSWFMAIFSLYYTILIYMLLKNIYRHYEKPDV
jgi:phosphatidylglycerophosphate synthase